MLPPIGRFALALILAAIAAGCTAPEESRPLDLDNATDRSATPDGQERNASNVTANDTLPGLDLPAVPT